MKNQDTCEECFKIKCRGCGWEPTDAEVILIQKEILTKCPACSWSPRQDLASKTI